ncbi:unnamed protein product, partial [Medioppia subpectinata]
MTVIHTMLSWTLIVAILMVNSDCANHHGQLRPNRPKCVEVQTVIDIICATSLLHHEKRDE